MYFILNKSMQQQQYKMKEIQCVFKLQQQKGSLCTKS